MKCLRLVLFSPGMCTNTSLQQSGRRYLGASPNKTYNINIWAIKGNVTNLPTSTIRSPESFGRQKIFESWQRVNNLK